MLRLIARIDSRNGQHIKTINCEGVKKIRPLNETIKIFSDGIQEHDELIIIDSVASLYGFDNWLLRDSNSYTYSQIPLTIGGGINSIDKVKKTLAAGADKILINTSCINNHKLIESISNKIGRQALVVQIDTRKINNNYYCFTHGGRELTDKKLSNWINEVHSLGAGEIHVTSIDSEGTKNRFPDEIAKICSDNTNLPLIISGGLRSAQDIYEINRKYNINAFSFSSMTNILQISLKQLRNDLINLGAKVRL